MLNDKTKSKVFSRRIFIFGSMHLIITSVFTIRLYNLQIKNNKKYLSLSDGNRVRVTFTPPLRGKILDCNNLELATNVSAYRVLCDPYKISDINSLIDTLISITKIPINNSIIQKIKANKTQIHILYDEVNWQTLSDIEFNMEKLNGILIDTFYKRYYPFGKYCANIIGYTKIYNQIDYINKPNYRLGIAGIEYTYDSVLKGKPGNIRQEVNAKGRVISTLSTFPHSIGKTVKLTIDIRLHETILKILQNYNGSINVIDVKTGNLLALCSSPTFDNNMFVNGISSKDWQDINNNPNLPLINRSITLQTQPASTFKIISALAAIEAGVITPDTKILCEGSITIGNTEFRCWKREGHGFLNLHEAITTSCNCYFYEIGQKINIDTIVNMAKNCGLGENFNIGLPEVASGVLPSKRWRGKKLTKTKWQLGDTLNVIIGHGFMLSTPLQLAVFAARVATGNTIMPNLIINQNKPLQNFRQLNVDPQNLAIIQEAMFKVTHARSGTASQYLRAAGLSVLMPLAGKTGTPQIISTKEERGKILQEEKKYKNHGVFIGYAPYYDPKYAISVVLEHVGGPRQAVLMAQKVCNYLHNLG